MMLEQAMQGHIIGQYEVAGLSKETKRTGYAEQPGGATNTRSTIEFP
jgi:hypothetical protein